MLAWAGAAGITGEDVELADVVIGALDDVYLASWRAAGGGRTVG